MKSEQLQKILVVGASGFLGRHLVEGLLQQDYEVVALDRHNVIPAQQRLEIIEGSFLDIDCMSSLFGEADAVFHLASTTLPKTSNDDPLFDIDSNLKGTVALLDLAVEHDIKRFIFISSGGTVYGRPQALPVPETHPTDPSCSYGVVKLAIEKYLLMYHQLHGLETCSLRLANPYGEYQRSDSGQGAVTAFCHRALHGEAIEIWGDGSVVRDFIYAGDAIEAMIKALSAPCAGQSINIGSGQGVSLNQLLDFIEQACGQLAIRDYRAARSFDVPEIYLDIQKAQRILAWRPQVPLEKGLERLVKTMRARAQS